MNPILAGIASMFLTLLACNLSLAHTQEHKERVGGYEVTLPKAWQIARKDGHLVAVSPAPSKAEQLTLLFLKDLPAQGDLKDVHQLIWSKFGGQKPDAEQSSDENGVKTRITMGTLKSDAAFVYGMQISVAGAGRVQTTLALAETKATLQKNSGAIQAIISTMQYVDSEKAPASSAPTPSGSGKFRTDLFGAPDDIAGFYFGYRVGVTSGGDLGARGSNIILYKDGTYTTLFPTGGFDAYDLSAHKQALSGNFHRWTREGNTIILDEGNTKWRYKVEGKNLVGSSNAGGKDYKPISPATGLTFSGTYAKQDYKPDQFTNREVYPNGMWTLTFREDGSFVDNSQVRPLYGTPPDTKPLSDEAIKALTAPGRGRYRIANNTLYLSYDDGRVVRLGFWILPVDAGSTKPKTIYINESPLTRRE